MTFRAAFVIACLLGWVVAATASAQPAPLLNAPTPFSVQRNQSTEIALTGGALGNVTSVALPTNSGLTAAIVQPEKPNGVDLKLNLKADPDAKPGLREIRLVSPTGVSNPAQVWVEQYPLVVDKAPNTDPAKAQPIPLPAVISGNIDAPGDSDCYRFTAAKGQVLVFNVFAGRLRSGLDANLIVYDASNLRELASNNDTFGPDPFLAFTVPAHGEYVVEIRDLQYRGGPNFGYRIEAGQIPFVQSISPMTSRRGGVVEVKATGFNLGDAGNIRLDLTNVPPGRLPLRVTTPAGVSNELPFEVTERPEVVEAEPNDEFAKATNVVPGTDITGVIGAPNDVDFYRFELDKPTRVVAEAFARRIGSPLDVILTLQDAKGNAIKTSDDAAGADARFGQDLAAGEYVLSIRDLGYNGGPAYAYRLSVSPTLAPTDAPPQDFAMKFQPDAPRLYKGAQTKLWCDVGRMNFPPDVSITVEGLPPGVTVASPTVFPAVTSGILMLSASGDAPAGTYPITVKATAPLNGELVTRAGQPESQGRVLQQAYLTVLDAPAPYAVAPLATVPAERVQQLTADIPTLANKVLAPSQEVDARQAEWEKKVTSNPTWVVLDPQALSSKAKASLVKDPDGSILATGRKDASEVYTITANTTLKGIRAVRLEVLPHPSFPNNGPGMAGNGNFVLNRFAATIAPKSNPPQAKPVTFEKAQATFSQAGYEPAGAIDDNATSGWAIHPETGKAQSAIFLTKDAVGDGAESVLTFTLEQLYGSNHVIGRFRLSVSTDPNAANAASVPQEVLSVVRVAPEKRTPQQRAMVGIYYRSIDPVLAPDIVRLVQLQSLVGPQAEIARLDAALRTQTPQLDAEQAAWETSLAAGGGWTPLDATDVHSAAGASFAKEADGSFFVFGQNAPSDTYTFVAATSLKNVTGVRIEALPDPRLPNNGPGRAPSGNFILSGLRVSVAPAANPASSIPVETAGASASFEQDKFPVSAALDEKTETGWAVGPLQGRPASAQFGFKTPQGADGGSVFTITLEHQASSIPLHTLGRFRVSLTSAPHTADAEAIPSNIQAILKLPVGQRNDGHKVELAAYHRRVAKSLQPVRTRLAELRSATPAFPFTARRGTAGTLPVAITRGPGFPTGDVQVTLEGFSLGRDANGPIPISRSLKVTPVTIPGAMPVGSLGFTVEGNAEQGTRLVVLRAEAKVGNDTVVQYSPAFPLTVN
jgi:hypothetical protein